MLLALKVALGGERERGIQSSKWQNIIMQRKCICCGRFPAVINKNNVDMDNFYPVVQAAYLTENDDLLKKASEFIGKNQ